MSPALISKLTSLTAIKPTKRLTRPRTVSTGVPRCGMLRRANRGASAAIAAGAVLGM